MVRWRLCLAIAVLLILPIVIDSKHDDDDDDEDSENKEDLRISKISKPKFNQNSRRVEDPEDDDDEDEDEDDDGDDKGGISGVKGSGMMAAAQEPLVGRRAPMLMATPKSVVMSDPRVPKKRPLECFVCAYKQETPLRACLDPTKFRVHTITCHSIDDRCFTSVVSKGDNYEAIVRGCRSGCVGSSETTCCDINRCNNKAFAMPATQPRRDASKSAAPVALTSKSSKCLPPSIVFFITVLLILQTVGKVAFV